MRKQMLIILTIILISFTTTVFAEREYIGETVVKDNMLFINGNSIPAAQLPNEFVYLPIDVLEYFGFNIVYNDANGYKEYILKRNETDIYVPDFTYKAQHYSNITKVYETNAKVYLDSDVPANVYELENGTVLMQSDELAKYGTYHWNIEEGTIDINFNNMKFLPVGQPFHNVIGLNDVSEIGSGVIVRGDGQCADIELEDLQKWLNTYWNFAPFDRTVGPYDSYTLQEYYIKFWTKDKTKSFVVYSNGNIIVGGYGKLCYSHGELKKNLIWYSPYIGNARSALYTANNTLFQKYLNERSETFANKLRDVEVTDGINLPENNLLITEGASSWAKPEIEKAASCNLLPYELTEKYMQNITRYEFCNLIYRLIATEFYPNSDSRQGEWYAIDNVISERQLTNKFNSISFSDCNDDKIKFLSAAGIINGMGDGSFSPDASITREQAATILLRTAGFLGNKTIPTAMKMSFSDESAIADWAKSAVACMNAMNIMNGVSEMQFSPKGNYTVEQAIATILRLYECF